MSNIFEPLTLAAGSHESGSGKGCAMNVISWENGDKVITDYPACSDHFLSKIVQEVNDHLAENNGILSAADSIIALDLGHATVGTTNHNLSDAELDFVYVRCTAFAARKVSHFDTTGTALTAILAAEKGVYEPTEENATAAGAATDAITYILRPEVFSGSPAADFALEAARYASFALTVAGDQDRSRAAAELCYSNVVKSTVAAEVVGSTNRIRIDLAWEIIDLFKALTGTDSPAVDETAVASAVEKMRAHA